MKKLISAKDLEKILEKGLKEVEIDKNTILTPLAKDIIKNNNLKLIVKKEEKEKSSFENIEAEKLIEFFRLASKNEELKNAILEMLKMEKKFEQEIDPSGLIITRGESIKYDRVFEGSNIFCQSIVNNKDEIISFLQLENDQLMKKVESKGNLYIIDGELELIFDDKRYFVKKGDLINLPENIELNIFSKNTAKLLCFSKELNWT